MKVTGDYAVEALISISLINSGVTDKDITRETLSGIYCVDKLHGNTFQIT